MKKEFIDKISRFVQDIAEAFKTELNQRFPEVEYQMTPNSDEITIRAINQEFGDIKLYFGLKEITVLLGDHFHTHFDMEASHKNIFDNNSRQVIEDVLQLLENVIREKVLLRVVKNRDKVISAGIVYADSASMPIESMAEISGLMSGLFAGKSKDVVFYSWTGRKGL